MIDDRVEYDWAESLQRDPEDDRFRAKAWVVMLCGVAAFWIVVAAVVALIFRGG